MKFSSNQKIAAKHLYALISGMSETQRSAVALLLSTLGLMAEDGYLGGGDGNDPDFYVLCYDVLAGTSLALKMLTDDDMVPVLTRDILEISDQQSKAFQVEADLAVQRIERQMAMIPRLDEVTKQ